MHVRPNALASQRLLEGFPFRHSDDVLMEDMIGPIAAGWSLDCVAEPLVICQSDPLAASVVVGQARQFGAQNRGLQLVESAAATRNLAHIALPPTVFA